MQRPGAKERPKKKLRSPVKWRGRLRPTCFEGKRTKFSMETCTMPRLLTCQLHWTLTRLGSFLPWCIYEYKYSSLYLSHQAHLRLSFDQFHPKLHLSLLISPYSSYSDFIPLKIYHSSICALLNRYSTSAPCSSQPYLWRIVVNTFSVQAITWLPWTK